MLRISKLLYILDVQWNKQNQECAINRHVYDNAGTGMEMPIGNTSVHSHANENPTPLVAFRMLAAVDRMLDISPLVEATASGLLWNHSLDDILHLSFIKFASMVTLTILSLCLPLFLHYILFWSPSHSTDVNKDGNDNTLRAMFSIIMIFALVINS